MGYLDSKGLERYSWNIRNKMASNVQMTKTAPMVQFCSASESTLEPIVDFIFKETLPAEGTKGPDNPSTFSGVSEVSITRCGKNLIKAPYYDASGKEDNGVTWTVNADGSITANGTVGSTGYSRFFLQNNIGIRTNGILLPPGTYFLSGCPAGGSNDTYAVQFITHSDDIPKVSNLFDYGNGRIFTVYEATRVSFYVVAVHGTDVTGLTFKPQLEYASKATDFELYSGDDYSLSLGNTYYGGRVNFATGEMTVTHYGEYLSNITNVELVASGVRTTYSTTHGHTGVVNASTDFLSNYDSENATYVYPRYSAGTPRVSTVLSYEILGLDAQTATVETATTAMNEFLTAHPCFIVYKIHSPYTYNVQLDSIQIKSLPSTDKYNPTLNTVYSDQKSVQVGWIREDFIHKSGEETITGLKTITGSIRPEQHVVGTIIRNNDFTRGTNPSHDVYWSIPLCDASSPEWDVEQSKNHGRAGLLECRAASNGNITTSIRAYKNDLDSVNKSIIAASYDLVNDIAYATAPETSDERFGSTDIVTRKWVTEKMWNWQKTLKKSFVQLKAIPESTLDAVVEFTFTETLPVEGAKGQSNPSVIDGISQVSVTRCGKNLLPKTHIGSTMESRGITATYNNDGSIHLSGTANSSYLPYLRFFTIEPGTVPSVFAANTTLTFSIKCSDSNVYGVLYDSDSPIAWGSGIAIRTTNTPVTYTMSSNIQTANFSLVVARGAVVDCDVYLQIEYGDKATEWEAPADTEYAISLNDTYYGGLIDLNSGLMTVTWEGIVLTGNETFNKYIANDTNNVYYTLATSYPAVSTTSCHCTHYPSGGAPGNCYVKTDEGKVVFIDNNIGSIENFKSWVANEYSNGTPVTVVYNISEPYTIQLTPIQISSLPSLDKYTPRINTIYTDAVSVQVGYQRYADEHKNADSASKLQSSVSLKTNLASTTAIAFDGSASQDNIPVTGVLPISNGGTGSSTQNFVDLSNSQVINGVKTFGSTIEGVVDRSIKDGSGNVIANTYATKATATSLADGLMSSTDKSKLDSIGTVFNFKGSVADAASLPGSGNTAGDAYLVQSPLGLQAWNGTSWVDIGSSALLPISDSEIDAVFA